MTPQNNCGITVGTGMAGGLNSRPVGLAANSADSSSVLVAIAMTVAPTPIPVLLYALPSDKLAMSSVIFRFPPSVSQGFMFIPLMEITMLAIVVSMDPMVVVIVIACGVERSRPKGDWANHGRHQNKRSEVSVCSHGILVPS
jgi:hypothetical protein